MHILQPSNTIPWAIRNRNTYIYVHQKLYVKTSVEAPLNKLEATHTSLTEE